MENNFIFVAQEIDQFHWIDDFTLTGNVTAYRSLRAMRDHISGYLKDRPPWFDRRVRFWKGRGPKSWFVLIGFEVSYVVTKVEIV